MTTQTIPAKTDLASLVRDYANYNLWANTTLVEWLKTKPAEAIEQLVPSSFPGIKGSLVHIWDTERFWLAVITKTAWPQSFREGYEGSVEDVFEGIVSHSAAFAEFVNSLDDEQLLESVHLSTPWVECDNSRFQYIHHCMNHSTYHRGQVITIGHHVGFHDAPMTDYNYYQVMLQYQAA